MWHVLFIYKPRPQRLIQLCVCLLLLVAAASQAKPQRIIALAPHLTEQVYSLGAGERLVATVDYADYPAAAKQLPRIGNYQYISIESIITLKPDLVLVWQQGNQRHLAEQLSALGIK
ncbi:ABC transporter substrate-binding protein, partial [Agarivorans sp.]|uniref:ABC transporter substrate-binding protein n=1 Tax=Agarivorans sp. TaxID=1872412 RepID=UPI003D02E33F